MNKDTHVYCTDCVNWDELYEWIYFDNNDCPYDCCFCHPLNPEDSFPFEIRKNYKVRHDSD